MGKRIPHLHAWQWRGYIDTHRDDLHVIATPLWVLAALLIIDGVFSLSVASLAIGVLGLFAAMGIQRHDRAAYAINQTQSRSAD